MKFGLRLALLLSLAACTVARPDDSFVPKEDDDADDDVDPQPTEGFDDDVEDDDTADDDEPPRDARVPAEGGGRTNDAGAPGRRDSSMSGPSGSGLDALAGTYLMRMDMYSSVATTRTPMLRLKNRVSNLMMVDLRVDDGKLVASEWMCDQSYAHSCESSNCKSWKTQLNSMVRSGYFGDPERAVTRSLSFDPESRELKGERASIPLGYDEKEGEQAVPSTRDDARVWKIGSEGRGMFSLMTASVQIAVSAQEVACEVENAQRFTTVFAGKLAAGTLSLEGVSFPLDLDATDGEVLAVRAANSTSASRSQCTKANFEDSSGMQGTATVRFKRFEGQCPSAAQFDSMFPPSPAFM